MTLHGTTSRPRVLFLAAGLIGLQAVVAAAFGLFEATQIRSFRLIVGAGAAVLMLGYGVFLAAIARGVARGRRWSRGPGVATQLLSILLAWSFHDGPTWWVTVTLAPVALLALICLLTPSATATFTAEPVAHADGDDH